MDGQANRPRDGWMDKRTDGETDGWTSEQTERHDEANSLFSQFCERAQKFYVVLALLLRVLYGSQNKQLDSFQH